MPVLKIDRVLSFSSEDEVHVANNILGNNTSRKWKCKSPGEKNAVLFLQLEKASVITAIDIGNEHSSYIEVLVSRSGDNDADYKTLLVMSAFMSAIDSRQSLNINRVRMFKKEDLSKPECDQKWDRIKIVCTQPFNRHVQYGLSFIKFHTNESDQGDNVETGKKLGRFLLRPDSPVNLANGSLFERRKELVVEKEKPLTAAAAIRAATSSLLDTGSSPARSSRLLPSCVQNLVSKKKKKNDSILLDDIPLKPRNRNELFYTEDEEKPNAKIDKLIDKKNSERNKKQDEEKEKTIKQIEKQTKQNQEKEKTIKQIEKQTKQNQEKDDESGKKTKGKEKIKAETSFSRKETSKRKLQEKNESSPKKTKCMRVMKPFDRLLEDVVLVISGIQNPDRAVLRGKILEMGAKYKPDWDSSCTHLVCAFMNTPKFNQVRSKGKIVTRKWIEQCHSQRKKLPWRRYALDKQETDKNESEDEIWEQIKDVPKPTSSKEDKKPEIKDDYDDTMEQASDTEDIIEQIKNSNSHTEEKENGISTENGVQGSSRLEERNDPYAAETDTDEETAERKEQIKHKPFDFFKNKTFFIDHNFEDYVEEMLKNYIFIHEGCLTDDPTESINYIICGKEEAQNLKEVNSDAVCILPDWVVDCHKCRQFIPPDEYFIL